jgi:type IV pilus assembly protein PilE
MNTPAPTRRTRGFTLIEVMIVVAIVAILSAIALPSYHEYIKRSSREAVQSELIELAAIQEKIFLNASGYATSVTAGYTGQASGGLGVPSGTSRDQRYSLSVAVANGAFTLTATPVAGSTQTGDGAITINAQGQRTRGAYTW